MSRLVITWKNPKVEKPTYTPSKGSTCVLLSLSPQTTQYPIKAWYDGTNFWSASTWELVTNINGWEYFPEPLE